MRAAVVMVAWSVGVAHAQPAGPADPTDPDLAFAACKTRRRAMTRDAMRIDDVRARGRALAQMPICRRLPDGSTEVIDPLVVPSEPRLPPAHRIDPEVIAGVAVWSMKTRALAVDQPGLAPVFAIASGVQLAGRLGIGAMASISVYSFAYELVEWNRVDRLVGREQLVDGAVELRLRADPLRFAFGLGAQQAHTIATSTIFGPRDVVEPLPMFEASAAFTIAHASGLALDVVATGTIAVDGSLETPGSIASARVALALRR